MITQPNRNRIYGARPRVESMVPVPAGVWKRHDGLGVRVIGFTVIDNSTGMSAADRPPT